MTLGLVSREVVAEELKNAIRYVKDEPNLEIPEDKPLVSADDDAAEYQLDSLDILELVLLCEERFGFILGVNSISLGDETTLTDVVDVVLQEIERLQSSGALV